MGLLRPLLLAPLFLVGCTEIYSQFCGDERRSVTCLKASDIRAQGIINGRFPSLDSNNCPFMLSTLVHTVNTCNNPKSNALGKSFDGYVRLRLDFEGQCYWRAQRDYREEGEYEAMEALVTRFNHDVITRQ